MEITRIIHRVYRVTLGKVISVIKEKKEEYDIDRAIAKALKEHGIEMRPMTEAEENELRNGRK